MCVGENGLERGKNVSWETRSSSFIRDTILDSGITVDSGTTEIPALACFLNSR